MERTDAINAEQPAVVVGLGASAGGIAALAQFFEELSEGAGAAYVVILHLDPVHASSIAAILGRHSTMPFSEATDGEPVRPDRVYVIPPNRTMTIAEGVLRLQAPVERRGLRMPIDHFFESLGEDLRNRSVGIVLSGTGSDGTIGLKAIRGAGGLSLVQDPATANQPAMARSAIAMGVVDHVLPVAQMPHVVARYARELGRNGNASTEEAAETDDAELAGVIEIVRSQLGHDFGSYRKGTIRRRIQRRLDARRIDSIPTYLLLLREDPKEVQALAAEMLIGVTAFFREREAWGELEELAIRPLVASKGDDETIRVWVPACATGEEAYSVAMDLLHEVDRSQKLTEVQVFATDIDRAAVEAARAGFYPESTAADIGPEFLRRYFVRDGDGFRIAKRVREAIVFAEQNAITDPPYSKLDLISCRNLLIYLEADRQKSLLSLFHFGLREGGYLFLGNSETIGQQPEQFETLSRKWRIFRRIGSSPTGAKGLSVVAPSFGPRKLHLGAFQPRGDREIRRAEQSVLRRFAPACVLVDRQCQIRYLFGPTERFLRQPDGPLTSNLLDWCPGPLRTKLRVGLKRAWNRQRGVETIDLMTDPADATALRVTIEPLVEIRDLKALALIAFYDAAPVKDAKPADSEADRSLVQALEVELQEARDDLRSTIEDLQSSNEDFKAVNEEAMSLNEELQSSNEELETSKEELQSLNEELLTVNFELQSKVGELEQRHTDLDNLLRSTGLAAIFLDGEFRIKWFSPAMTGLLNLLPSDVGRPLSDLAARYSDPDLLAAAASVLESGAPLSSEIRTHDGHWYLRRALPYTSRTDRIEGIVITFTDINALRVAQLELLERAQELERQVETRTGLLQLLQDVAQAANEATSVEDAVSAALKLVCTHARWHVGHAWEILEPSGIAVPTGFWYVAPGHDFTPFVEATMSLVLPPGDGLIRNTAASGVPQWVADLREIEFQRGNVEVFRLRSAATIPVPVKDRIAMVLEMYASDASPMPSDRMVISLSNVGVHVGRVIERRALEKVIADQTERERRTVGDELHDTVGQTITALALAAREVLARAKDADSPLVASIAPLEEGLELAKVELSKVIRGVLPPELDGHGLMHAIIDLAEITEARYGKRCRVLCNDPASLEIDGGFAGAQIYRIAQEALRNAVHHADATEICISLGGEKGFELEVADNGNGDWTRGRGRGAGIGIMRYRADLIGGHIDVVIEAGAGTRVRCLVPRRLRVR